MGLRLRSIRQRILLLVLVPVLSLIGLYIFATSITAGQAINLSRTHSLLVSTGQPTGYFFGAVGAELRQLHIGDQLVADGSRRAGSAMLPATIDDRPKVGHGVSNNKEVERSRLAIRSQGPAEPCPP